MLAHPILEQAVVGQNGANQKKQATVLLVATGDDHVSAVGSLVLPDSADRSSQDEPLARRPAQIGTAAVCRALRIWSRSYLSGLLSIELGVYRARLGNERCTRQPRKPSFLGHVPIPGDYVLLRQALALID